MSRPFSVNVPVNRLVAQLGTGRSWPQFVLPTVGIHPNQLFVIGGSAADTGSPLGTTERYDPTLNTWSAGAPLATAYATYGASLTQDPAHALGPLTANLLLAGGIDVGVSFRSQIYTDSTATWADTGDLNVPRADHCGIPQRVSIWPGTWGTLVTGGLTTGLVVTPTVEQWTAGVWALVNPMATARGGHALVDGGQGFLYALGGYTAVSALVGGPVLGVATGSGFQTNLCEKYDVTTGLWSAIAPMKHARYGHRAALLADGRILVAGGYVGGPAADGAPTPLCEIYDPSQNIWYSIQDLPDGQAYGAEVALADGTFLFSGGGLTGGEAALFKPDANAWIDVASPDLGVGGAVAGQAAAGGDVITAGSAQPYQARASANGVGAGLYDPQRRTFSASGTGVSVDLTGMNGAVRIGSMPDLASFNGTVKIDGSADEVAWVNLLTFAGTFGPVQQPFVGGFRFARARCTAFVTGLSSAEILGQTDDSI